MWPQRRWIDTLTTLLLLFTLAPEGFTLTGEATSTPCVLDSRPPEVSIFLPLGGEAFQPAVEETLQWSIVEDSYGANPLPVALAIVTGDTVIWAASVNPHHSSDYTYFWQVADFAAAQAFFVVATTDDFGWAVAETSAAFSIHGAPTTVTTQGSDLVALPESPGLGPIFPNPFNPATELQFALSQDASIELALFDLTGRRIQILARGSWPAGRHSLRWDGRDETGRRAASGTYLARLQVTDRGTKSRHVQRLTLLK